MKKVLSLGVALSVGMLFAERQPFERYQSIVDRQMFGQPPPGFDPTKPASEVSRQDQRELTQEQEKLQSSIQFSIINITPEGETAVGFTDNSDPKVPVHYYLKVGEERNGWIVKEADPATASMTISKDDIEVSLKIGENSGKGAGATARAGAANRAPAAASPHGRSGMLGSLRSRRQAREQLQAKEREAREAKAAEERAEREAREAQEKEEREQERRQNQQQLLAIQEELKKAREQRQKEAEKNKDAGDGNEDNDS